MSASAALQRAGKLLALVSLACLFVGAFHHRVTFGRQTFALAGTAGSMPAEAGVRRVVHDPYASSGQFEPWLEHQLREEALHGETPRWNPWQGLGAPFLANAQTAVYHPVRWLQAAVSPARAFDVSVLVHLATAAIGMWLLLRALGLERWPRALGAVAFASSGYLVFFANMVHLGAEALLPWHVLAIELLWNGRRLAGALLCGGTFALSHYAGFPEATALCALIALAWLLARVLHELGARRAGIWIALGIAGIAAAWFGVGGSFPVEARIARGNATAIAAAVWIAALCCVPRAVRARCSALGGAVLVGTLLAAPVLLPFFEFLSRAQHLHGAERGVGATSFDVGSWIGLVFPNLGHYGSGMNGGYEYGEPPYLGALVVGLGLLAPCLWWTSHPARKPALAFFALALLCTAKLFALPGIQWIGELPPLREIILRKYLGLPVAFAWAGAAACGLAAFRLVPLARQALLALALAAAGFYGWTTYAEGWSVLDLRWLRSTPLLVSAGALGVSALALFCWRQQRTAPLALVALLAFGATCELYLHAPRQRASRALSRATPKELQAWVGRLRGERVLAAQGVLPPNLATRYEIQDLRFLDAMVEAGFYRYLDARFDLELRDRWDGPALSQGLPSLEDLDDLGVRWFLAPRQWLPLLQEHRIDLAVVPSASAVRASAPRAGLLLTAGAKLSLGPLAVPKSGAARATFHGERIGTMPPVRAYRLGAPHTVFSTLPTALEVLRRQRGAEAGVERAAMGFGREQGRLPAETFANKPVLVSFRLHLDERTLPSARLDVTEVRWNGGPLSPDAFQAAKRLPGDLVADANGIRPARDAGVPNRFWLEPSAEPAFGAHLYVDLRFPPEVPAGALLRLAVEATPVLGEVPAPPWIAIPEGPSLDLTPFAGETIYLELEVPPGAACRVVDATLQDDSLHFKLHQREPLVVAENLRVKPPAYLTHHARVVAEEELASALASPLFEPRREAWVSGPHARALEDREALPERAVRVHRPRADTLVLDFEARGPGLLVVLEPYDPNWKVRVSQREAPLVPVFGAFRGVYVEDGDTRVVMQYRPDSWMLGRVIASATAGLVLLFLLLRLPLRAPART